MEPILAKDIRKMVNQFDPKIDEFIYEECEATLMRGDGITFIPIETLNKYDIEVRHCIKQLQLRGFAASQYCEDHSHGKCWIEITLPPGGE